MSASSVRVSPRRYGRLRTRLVQGLESLARRLGGRALYRRYWLAAGRTHQRVERVRCAHLPAELEGFSVVLLSDIHAGPFLGRGDLAHVVEQANATRPDLVAIVGDFITHDHEDALLVLDDLAELRSQYGTWAVFGNHDYRGRREGLIADAYEQRGIRFLRNAGARVASLPLVVTGLEDLEEARQIDLDQARAALEPGDFELCLCHNPSAAPALARAGCLAVLAGHTHGGQLDVPGLPSPGPPHPGLRVELGPTALIVSRGLGALGLPWRLRAPAELVVVRFESA